MGGSATNEQNVWIILLQILVMCLSLAMCSSSARNSTPTPPALFVFGDSLVDVGNNDGFNDTLSRANFYPYGIDFGKPTGRFTNNRTVVDIIGQEVGYKNFIPPFMAPPTVGKVILHGVNYASAACGILNVTGAELGKCINLDQQISNHEKIRKDIISMIGARAAKKLLRDSFYAVVMGSNDIILSTILPVQPQLFIEEVIARFTIQLERIYSMGARKIIVANVGPIGCIPYLRDTNPDAGDDCVEFPNQLAQLFNTQLKNLIIELRTNLAGSNFVYADVYHIVEDIIQNIGAYGFENGNSSCCHVPGRFGGLLLCIPLSQVCFDRSKYVFWDPYHPSDAANIIIARRLLDGNSNDIWPMNIRQLAKS